MKKICIVSLFMFVLAFLLPLSIIGTLDLRPANDSQSADNPQPTDNSQNTQKTTQPTENPTENPTETTASKDEDTKLTILIAGEPVEMTMNEYLYGVVSAEVPALYPLEALKAQAVAARTYATYALTQNPHHDNAVICDDFTHCMAYIGKDKAASNWGNDNVDEYTAKIKDAVDSTSGEILTYNGEIIDALFYAVSSGKTEAAKDIWGEDVPYLQAVNSEWDKQSDDYNHSLTVSLEDAKTKISERYPKIEFPKKVTDWKISRSPSGGVTDLEIGNTHIKGTEIREIFGLYSHNFTVSAKKNKLTFNTIGYGHGVGLSQFGSNMMAKDGKNYKEILKHYYVGVEI